MAVKHVCDGCGAEGDLVERGFFLKRQYCATCLPRVDRYLAARDAAHDKAAEMFRKQSEKLVKEAGIPLPDTRDA